MKLIWTGTDSLLLNRFPRQYPLRKLPYVLFLRLIARLSDFIAEENYACGELTEKNVKKFGLHRVKRFCDTLLCGDIVEKKPHEGFNILYYCPKVDNKWNRWLYGYDIYLGLKAWFPNLNFIRVDGCQDMKEIYPIVDLFIRPNRHDGHPRMIDECKLNGIPYIWTKENPSFDYFRLKIDDHLLKSKTLFN